MNCQCANKTDAGIRPAEHSNNNPIKPNRSLTFKVSPENKINHDDEGNLIKFILEGFASM